jgi:hypothetical protein
MNRWEEDIKAGAIGQQAGTTTSKEDISLAFLRLRMSHIADLCHFISAQHTTGTERDVSIRLALQYLRQDLGRTDVHLARLERKH